MNNKKHLVTSMVLTAGLTTASAFADHHHSNNQPHTAIPASAAAHGVMNKQSAKFNPPREMSPRQFEQLLQNNKSSDNYYLDNAKQPLKNVVKSKYAANKVSTASTQGCTSPSDLQTLTGQALVDAVKAGDLNSCLYGMFDASLVGTSLFSDDNMLTIADAIDDQLTGYDGTDVTAAAELEKLIIFLRAIHWAEWGNDRFLPELYTSKVNNALFKFAHSASFAFFNGNATRHHMVRYEFLILASAAGIDTVQFMEQFTDALVGYANTVSRADDWGVYYEENGVTQLLTHLYNATSDKPSQLAQEIQGNAKIIENLASFINDSGSWLIGHTREYQWSDSVKELARLLSLGEPIASTVRPHVKKILADYDYQGAGGDGWLNAQSMVTAYDSANCAEYGDACNFNLENAILSGIHTCSSSLTLRYQEPISASNLTKICNDLSAQESVFHTTFGTNQSTPVADDYNTSLEVVIFASYTDYDNYAGNFFGIGTNNGGMYLEGNPWVEGNQARFIAHQATWLPEFQVWNLEHEYVHYLDGRFNKWGNFDQQPANSVWWGEGLAEYLSQPNNNPDALAAAAQGTYNLSELFQTTYSNSDTTRTYHWGYLAVRYMMEEQAASITNELLPSMRAAKSVIATGECQFDWSWQWKQDAIDNGWYWAYDDSEWSSGNWVWTCGQPQPDSSQLPAFTPYEEVLSTWGTSFDQDFSEWLACLVAGEGECSRSANPADLDGNGTVDKRDVSLFVRKLRSREPLSLDYDFNSDGKVDFRDVRAMMAKCDLARCAIAS